VGKKCKLVAVLKHQAFKVFNGSGGEVPSITSAVDGGEWSASRPGRLPPGKDLPVPI